MVGKRNMEKGKGVNSYRERSSIGLMKEFYFLNPFLEKIILAFLKTKVGLSQIGAD